MLCSVSYKACCNCSVETNSRKHNDDDDDEYDEIQYSLL